MENRYLQLTLKLLKVEISASLKTVLLDAGSFFAEAAEDNLSGSYSGMFVFSLLVSLSTVYSSHFFTCPFFYLSVHD